MPLAHELNEIRGAQALYDWFGKWPSFHDAEIVSVHLNRRGPSSLVIHTWSMTNEVDERGCYLLEKHVVVEFVLDEVAELDFDGFNHQNVIFGLDLEKKGEGFVLTLDHCYGLAGTIEAKKIAIILKPGKPLDGLEID
jgi:Immunity protein 50